MSFQIQVELIQHNALVNNFLCCNFCSLVVVRTLELTSIQASISVLAMIVRSANCFENVLAEQLNQLISNACFTIPYNIEYLSVSSDLEVF